MIRSTFATILASALALPASAQIANLVRVSHDDDDGLVTPGQVVRISTTLSWETPTAQLSSIKGGLIASPNNGVASNRTSDFTQGSLVNLGTINGASVVGVDIAVTPAFFTGGFVVPPSGNYWGINIISIDWTVPDNPLGPVRFDWVPAATQPDVLFYVPTGPLWPPPPWTTYIGTQLTIIPTPSLPAFALAVAGWHASRRRRP